MKALLAKLRAPAPGHATTDDVERATGLVLEGNAREDAGRVDEAKRHYELAVAAAPGFARAHLNLGNARLALGDGRGAIEAFSEAIRLDPGYAGAHFNLGNALAAEGRLAEARGRYEEALRCGPGFASAHVALGAVLEAEGLAADAIAQYRSALEVAPDDVGAWYNVGTALVRTGDREGAIDALRRAIALDPSHADARMSLALALESAGRLADAEAEYRRVVAQVPGSALAHNSLGNVLAQSRRLPEAIDAYRRALELEPRYPEALCNLGNALMAAGNAPAAEAHYRRALELRPDFAEAHSNLGNLLKNAGRPDDALACYARAVEARPGFAEAWFNHANVLQEIGRPEDALASFARALDARPGFVEALGNLGNVLKDQGRIDEAETTYRKALALDPGFAQAHSSLLFCLAHDERAAPDALLEEHLRFGERVEARWRGAWPAHGNVRDPARVLRVGFVSGDLRDHPVAYFVEPVVEHLARSPGVELHAYHAAEREDHVSARMRAHFRAWNPVHGEDDDALFGRIRGDAIDVLIDLSGHTADHRLAAFARKPAPLQASWIGYPGTTGLRAMDYYLSDAHLLPLDPFAGQFTEKLVHLPASAPFRSMKDAPPANALPALANGHLTFASFNRPSKLRPATVRLWAELLRALPSSRMLVAGMTQDGQYDWIKAMFADSGVSRDRLTFVTRCATPEYLALHAKVDLCLDTFPYSGGTTANHALWMGVPTLTIAGRTPAGRQGTANMLRAGLPGFVARDAADFVARGIAWSRNLETLAAVRESGRARLERAPARRPEAIAAGLERALRTMWRRWCEGLPPAPIDASEVEGAPASPFPIVDAPEEGRAP